MPDIVYSYKHCPTIWEFAQSDAFIRGLIGPFGSGKSSGCVAEIIRRGLAQKPGPDGVRRTRWAVVRNSYPQLTDTTIATVHQWCPPHIFGDWRANDHRYIIKHFDKCEIEILFRALDRPDQVANLLSLELTGAWVNEAREVPWSIIEALQGRVGRYPAVRDGGPTWFGVIMDTNPPDADSRWYRFFEEEDHSEAVKELAKFLPGLTAENFSRIFKQPSGLSDRAENLNNLQPGYYQRLAIGKDPEWVKVYVKGEYGFVMDGKPVFPEYSDELHCREVNPVSGVPIHRGFDFGLTPACAFSQVLPDGRWLVFDELVSEDMGIERFADVVQEHSAACFPKGAEFVDTGDPAGQQRAQTDEKTCFQIMRAKGFFIDPGLQTPAIRFESMRKPMRNIVAKKPQFILHPRCTVLRKGLMGGYHFRRMKVSGERYADVPEKNRYSHVNDACQYTATRIFGGGLTQPKQSNDARGRYDDQWDDRTRSAVTGY